VSFLSRLNEIVQINVDDLIEQAEDPGKALDQFIDDMQVVFTQTKAIISGINSIQNQKAKTNYGVAIAEVSKWQTNLGKAQRANNERLTFYARERLKNHKASARIAKSQLDEYTEHEDILKKTLNILQEKITEAETIKYLLRSSATSQLYLPVIKASNPTLESKLRKIEHELESTKTQLIEQQKITDQLLSQNSVSLKHIRDLLAELEFNKDIDDDLESLKQQIDNL
jgi:phage shock protein A